MDVIKGVTSIEGSLNGRIRAPENTRTTGSLTIPVIAYRELPNEEGGITVLIGGGRDENDPE